MQIQPAQICHQKTKVMLQNAWSLMIDGLVFLLFYALFAYCNE